MGLCSGRGNSVIIRELLLYPQSLLAKLTVHKVLEARVCPDQSKTASKGHELSQIYYLNCRGAQSNCLGVSFLRGLHSGSFPYQTSHALLLRLGEFDLIESNLGGIFH